MRRKSSSKKIENDDDEIQLEMDEGDQMIYNGNQEQKSVRTASKPRNVLSEMGITELEARELKAHETTLMEEGRGMNIKFNTANS